MNIPNHLPIAACSHSFEENEAQMHPFLCQKQLALEVNPRRDILSLGIQPFQPFRDLPLHFLKQKWLPSYCKKLPLRLGVELHFLRWTLKWKYIFQHDKNFKKFRFPKPGSRARLLTFSSDCPPTNLDAISPLI